MPSHTSAPTTPPTTGYRALLRNREFAGLYAGFTLTVAATTLSGFALGTLVQEQTRSPFLTAVSMYGATFATVLGALTLMSVADGSRPRRTLVALQCVSLAGVTAQAIPGLSLAARFGLLLLLGFFQSLGTGTRMGLLAEVVPTTQYALARSLMNITSGGTAVLGYATGAALLARLTPQGVFITAATLTGVATALVATTVRERSIRLTRRPGLRRTWRTNAELFSHSGGRALLLNLWVPNGLIVGCEALFISYAPEHAGLLLAAGSAGMLLGDLAVGRFLGPAQRRRHSYTLRLLLAAPYLLFAAHPHVLVAVAAVFVSGAGFAATLPLQEQLLELTPEPVRGQVQGVESAGRMTWQGIGAAIAGGLAGHLTPATTITALAAVSVAVTVVSRPFVRRARTVRDEKAPGVVEQVAALAHVIDKPAAAGVTMEEPQRPTAVDDGPLAAATVVVTGKMSGPLAKLGRSEMNALIEKAGGKAGSSVNSKTTYLVCAPSANGEPSSKALKAAELGVTVLTPEAFAELVAEFTVQVVS